MAHFTSKDSEFYAKYPIVRQTYWLVIDNARDVIDNPLEKSGGFSLFIDWIRSELSGLEKEKASGLYKNYVDCEELKEIEAALKDALERLLSTAKEHKIDWENDLTHITLDEDYAKIRSAHETQSN